MNKEIAAREGYGSQIGKSAKSKALRGKKKQIETKEDKYFIRKEKQEDSRLK